MNTFCQQPILVFIFLFLGVPAFALAGDPTDQIKQTTEKVLAIVDTPALKGPDKEAERQKQFGAGRRRRRHGLGVRRVGGEAFGRQAQPLEVGPGPFHGRFVVLHQHPAPELAAQQGGKEPDPDRDGDRGTCCHASCQ